jgi:small subunit ribosomal protein S10
MNTNPSNDNAQSSRIEVKFFSYDHSLVDNAVFVVKNSLAGTGVKIRGAVPMPTRRKVFTVNRSPHVDKKSREHFAIKTYKRLVSLSNCDHIVVDRLLKVALPAGVEIKIKYR